MELNQIKQAARMIREKKTGTVFTGAGISTGSGIPDFRSSKGIWSRFDIREYGSIDSFKENPEKVWKFFSEIEKSFLKTSPNPGHFALAEMEKLGHLEAVVTQNIDGLHKRAGSRAIYEIHGSLDEMVCLVCKKRYSSSSALVKRENMFPYCECGEILKPGVVFFGEALPEKIFEEALSLTLKNHFIILVGASLQVYPAAQIPFLAKRNGLAVIEINLEKTSMTSRISDVFIQGKTEEILPILVDELKEKV
ncbi:MAG TPA: RNA polymerase subunit sigma [Spirochaetia bacterium]|nr:MAG: hypothetical protein A2Y41_01095 [Spirochaetes bacterium GWB1_36_13]HCL57534.1 RNA polymerase subunit sigma [Spirochaetia bacterium]